jgi:hypothetical protein
MGSIYNYEDMVIILRCVSITIEDRMGLDRKHSDEDERELKRKEKMWDAFLAIDRALEVSHFVYNPAVDIFILCMVL